MHHSYCEYQMLLKMMDQWADKGRPTSDFHREVTGPESGAGLGRGRVRAFGSAWALTQMERASQEAARGRRSTCKIHMKFLCVLKPRCLRETEVPLEECWSATKNRGSEVPGGTWGLRRCESTRGFLKPGETQQHTLGCVISWQRRLEAASETKLLRAVT